MLATATLRTPFHLTRASAFSYECKACKRCCQGKRIPVNPYEVARLAERVGMSTTDFLAKHTEVGGAVLRRREEDDTCVFLGPQGCGVHPDRPLACRLYPLGRQRTGAGDERFAESVPHPRTEGVYGTQGTVEDFLRSQDVERHVAMADRYGAALGGMIAALARLDEGAEAQTEALRAMEGPTEAGIDNLLDLDATVAAYCAERGLAVPADVDARALLHVAAIEAFVARLEPAPSGAGSSA
jgi:Fe-S-cluster containining protein